MIVEDFDFKDFFEEEKKFLQAEGKSYYGVGCVAFITDKQVVIRWNESLKDTKGNIEKGLGLHATNVRGIAHDLLGSDNSDAQSRIMNDSIFLMITNSDICNAVVHLPIYVTTNQLKGLDYLREKLKGVIPEDDFEIMIDNFIEEDEIIDLDYLYEKAESKEDNNHIYPYDENILVENGIELSTRVHSM